MIIPALKRCRSGGCKAMTSNLWCPRCREAIARDPAEHAMASAAAFLAEHLEATVRQAIHVGEVDAKFLYGSLSPDDAVKPPPIGLVSHV